MNTFQVAEIFTSINGEGRKAGQLAVFVRFCGCNLNCCYCDTQWANQPGVTYTVMTTEEIVARVEKEHVKNVTITGGEPLLQHGISELLEALSKTGVEIEIETNGSVPTADIYQNEHISFTLDYKLPYSGMEAKMYMENYARVRENDTVKFVCGSRQDLQKAKEVIDAYDLASRCAVYLSPVFGAIKPADMVDFMKEENMNGVHLQLQLHKFIWDPNERGV